MSNQINELIKGLDSVVKTKTVVGDPIKIDNATIIPLIEVTFGIGSGEFSKPGNEKYAGGMGAKMVPYAMLVIQNGITKVVNIRDQDAVTKAIDLVPDVVNKITGKKVDESIIHKAKRVIKEGI